MLYLSLPDILFSERFNITDFPKNYNPIYTKNKVDIHKKIKQLF